MAKKNFTLASSPVVPQVGAASLPQYADLSMSARYLTTLAEKAGLAVSHNGKRWIWVGAVQQHQSSRAWAVSQCWTFKSHRKAWTTMLLANLSRDRADPNIIRAEIECFHGMTADGRVLGPLADRAQNDGGHKAFMARTLAAVDISGDEVPEPGPAPVRPHARESAPSCRPDSSAPDNPIVRLASKVVGAWTTGDFRSAVLISVDKAGKAHLNVANLNDRAVLGLLAQMSARVARDVEDRESDEGDEA